MSGWHEQRMVALDFESTSANPEEARPVTCCIAWVGGGQPTELRRWLINAGVPVPDEAAAIHGVTTEQVQADGIPVTAAVEGILGELDIAHAEQMPLVIMNANYDLTLLDREHRRAYNEPLPTHYLRPVVDPMVIDRALDKWRRGRRTLTDLCAHYQVSLDGAHSADEDALAAARLTWRIAQVYPDECGDLEDLHDRQVTWRREWAVDFRDYLRKQGKPADDVRGDWPLTPYTTAAVGAA